MHALLATPEARALASSRSHEALREVARAVLDAGPHGRP
jgi:hypothetical protein